MIVNVNQSPCQMYNVTQLSFSEVYQLKCCGFPFVSFALDKVSIYFAVHSFVARDTSGHHGRRVRGEARPERPDGGDPTGRGDGRHGRPRPPPRHDRHRARRLRPHPLLHPQRDLRGAEARPLLGDGGEDVAGVPGGSKTRN